MVRRKFSPEFKLEEVKLVRDRGGFGDCEPGRNSQPSMPRCTTCSMQSAPSPAEAFSKPTAPPLSPSGVNSVWPDAERLWANGDRFALV